MKDIELDFDDDAAWFAHLDLHIGAALHEAAFDPAAHPRGASGTTHGGEFVKKGAGAGEKKPKPIKRPSITTVVTGSEHVEGDWQKATAEDVQRFSISGPESIGQTLQQLPAAHLQVARNHLHTVEIARLASDTAGEFGWNEGIIRLDQGEVRKGSFPGTIAHEFGHALHRSILGSVYSREFVEIYKSEQVTQYGAKDFKEGFAEAYAMYSAPAGRAYMKDATPRTHAYMQKVFAAPYDSHTGKLGVL